MSRKNQDQKAQAGSIGRIRVEIGATQTFAHVVLDWEKLLQELPQNTGRATTYGYGAFLWDSSRSFCQWLLQPEARRWLPRQGLVVELGCGVGFVSAWLARFWGVSVLATDADLALAPLVRLNADEQGVAEQVQFRLLPWEGLISPDLSGQTMLACACDVLYDLRSTAALSACVQQLLAPGGHVIIVDPGRYAFASALACLSSDLDLVLHQEIPWDDAGTPFQLLILRKRRLTFSL